MRKYSLLLAFVITTILAGSSRVSAQTTRDAGGTSYSSALGLGLDFGNGTLVGVSGKHFFTPNNAGAAELLFGNHTTALRAFYQYHQQFVGAPGLRWFIGGGPSLNFISVGGFHQTDFALIPMAGFDYKIANVPFNISFDWRPTFFLTHGAGSDAGRFGLGFRYAFNQR